MLKHFWIAAFLLFATSHCLAQGSCQSKPGQTTIEVTLYDTSMEPKCQPTRIRVSDRTAVTLKIKEISPLEVCSIAPKAQTLTTVTNPIDAIFSTITGYKNFEIGIAKAHAAFYTKQGAGADEKALKIFEGLSDLVIPTGQAIVTKQNMAQGQYSGDITALTAYAAGNYRGTAWSTFDPDNAAILAQAKKDSQFPPLLADGTTKVPSELDWAPLQALIDQMKTLLPRLVNSCTTAGTECNATALSETATDIERANSILTVLQDNFKSLQTQQAAITAGFTALKKMQTDFVTRVSTGVVKKDPPDAGAGLPLVSPGKQILYMPIILGKDYGSTDTGTISCSTDTTPAVPTTDAINYTVLYQKVPALTVSTGILLTFLPKYQYGVASILDPGSINRGSTPPNPGTFTNYFSQTDYARASVFPMAFVNYRLGKPFLKSWWAEPNSELVITNNVSAGIGVNPNTGTNQTEFFVGYAVGFSRAMVHFGEHWGRQESLGGGFTVNTPVPTGWSSSNMVPIDWKYNHFFAIGFSIRIAPF